ncbi:ABC-2 type transport system ATP-binding protein [Lachnospiraceae bacterium]|nr:ABC-2 type transport system ATP-binding protein [Lachnospiraceae bacterium]
MIKVDNIHKTFAYNKVLRGVSFEVEAGSIYGLIGRNGAGKTTLMNIMSGLMEADSGKCIIKKDDSTEPGSRVSSFSRIGYLPDLPEFYDYLTTDEYLDLLLMDQNPVRRDELLKLVSLPPNVRLKTMSRGMRQRLGIAAVLVNNPDIILLDEPTSALDPSGRNDVKNILMKLKEEGKTIILSTHILADMDSICDKAGFLNNGVIVREVDVAKVRSQTSEILVTFKKEPDLDELYKYAPVMYVIDPQTIRIVIDENNKQESQQRALQGIAAQGIEIAKITSAALSLDSIFQEVCAG